MSLNISVIKVCETIFVVKYVNVAVLYLEYSNIKIGKCDLHMQFHINYRGGCRILRMGGFSYCAREAREKFSSTTPTFVWATPPFRSRLPLNRQPLERRRKNL